MRLLITEAPAVAVSNQLRDGDIVWHLDEDIATQLKSAGVVAYSTADLMPNGGAEASRREIVQWLDSIGGNIDDELSLRSLSRYGDYSLWEPVRQSLYSNFRSRMRTDRLLLSTACLQSAVARHPDLAQINCQVRDTSMIEAARRVARTHGLRIGPLGQSLHAAFARRRDWARMLLTEVMRVAKESLQVFFAACTRCRHHLKQPFAVSISYAPLVRSRTLLKDVTGVSLLRDELERRGLSTLNVVIDYSTGLNLSLVRRRSRDIAFEAFLSPKDALASARLALSILRRWRAISRRWREQGTFVYRGVDLWPSLRGLILYYACVFVPKSVLYTKAFERLYALGPTYALMIGEYSRLGQCAIIAARSSGVTFCGIQHARIDSTHPAYIPVDPALNVNQPLPDIFFAFGKRDERFLAERFPDLAAVTRVVGYLNHDRLHRLLTQDRTELRERLKIPADALVVAIFDNDNDPGSLSAMTDDIDSLIQTEGIWGILHPHPRTVHPDSYFRKLVQGKSPRLRYTAGEDSYVILAASDIFLVPSGASTMLGEAAVLGKPTYFAAWNSSVSAKNLHETMAKPLLERDALIREILGLIRDNRLSGMSKNSNSTNDSFMIDGQVACRIADAIEISR